MSELRQNRITGEWVIIATERSQRPADFHRKNELPKPPRFVADCPFCPGNEEMTPPEILAARPANPHQNSKGWKVRVVSNKFPALNTFNSANWFHEANFFNAVEGYGIHDVIVDTPRHDLTIGTMSYEEVELLFQIYQERYRQIEKDEQILMITVFRNQGAQAGASLEHPHSQLIATPIIPTRIQMRLDVAKDYFQTHKRCITCDMIERTLSVEARVIVDSERYVVFHPFASQAPFETWIVPKRHNPSYGEATPEEVKELAHIMRDILHKMYLGLGDPDYNYLIQPSPTNTHFRDRYHWYLQILPRVTPTVGFEVCSGIYISTARPEETAEFIRNMK